MKFPVFLRFVSALLIIFCIFTAPIAAVAAVKADANKNFKQGMQYEVKEQWDKAAEEFALAVAAKPGNIEYRLHYRRALFNASQMMVQRGRTLAEQKDFVGAYNAFRQAYGYDPTNELAKAEMERMLRLQQQGDDPNDPNKPKENPANAAPAQPSGVKLVPTAYNQNAKQASAPQPQDATQLEQLRDIKYTKVDLKTVIRDLAQALDLNVIFDSETFRSPRDFSIELKNVTTAQALDYIFLQESLFFQKVGKRAVLVANQNRRQNFQQLVLRTFYLANAKPDDVRNLLTQAIPPQPGRPPVTAIVDKDTNSITVRDTTENLKIISNLIKSIDKDRAEVVMDVNIFEVSKTDLLNLGVQIGSEAGLSNLGGSTSAVVGIGGSDNFGQSTNAQGAVTGLLPRNIATGILLPAATLQAFQRKDNTRLLASTQVHAFNNEESQARIGQRVPVQTAQTFPFSGGQTQNNGGANGIFGGSGFPVINYEQVGLTLKFTPIVFPNQDVQVKMSIESKDVLNSSLTPTFTERTISGTARIQNNRTLLLASVAQDTQSNGRSGLPLLGLIPVIGRLFSAPRRNNSQVDIVIAVTPRVLRSPVITPEDEVEQSTGSIAVPTNSSLANMLQQEDQDDRLATARRVPNTAVVQLPDQKPEDRAETPAYTSANVQPSGSQNNAVAAPTTPVSSSTPAATLKPIDISVKTLNIAPTSQQLNTQPAITNQAPPTQSPATTSAPKVKPPSDVEPLVNIEPIGALIKGERRRIAVTVKSPSALRLAILSLDYNPGKIVVHKIVYGDVYGAGTAKTNAPFAGSSGVLMATLPAKADAWAQGAGVLAYLDIEALADGDATLQINQVASSLIGVNGQNLVAMK